MFQLGSSAFVLLIVDVNEPSVRICVTINCGAYIRAPHVIIKTEHVLIKTEGADQLYCRTGLSAPLFSAAYEGVSKSSCTNAISF